LEAVSELIAAEILTPASNVELAIGGGAELIEWLSSE